MDFSKVLEAKDISVQKSVSRNVWLCKKHGMAFCKFNCKKGLE